MLIELVENKKGKIYFYSKLILNQDTVTYY